MGSEEQPGVVTREHQPTVKLGQGDYEQDIDEFNVFGGAVIAAIAGVLGVFIVAAGVIGLILLISHWLVDS